jgi:hypothetical protein
MVERSGSSNEIACSQGWEGLRGDSLGWLLEPARPNLQWRVLVELVGRPEDSPAVRRARGGASAAEPVASLLAELHPDGVWANSAATWAPYDGPGWRLIAAVRWGADPEDPRLHAASDRLLDAMNDHGGIARPRHPDGDPRLTARALEAMVALGWRRHPRVQEWLAWFEATRGWERDPVAAVGVLHASGGGLRPVLVVRAVNGLDRCLQAPATRSTTALGYPNLLRTDLAEIFAAFAEAEVEWRESWQPALERLQRLQDERGRWPRRSSVPASLRAPTPQQPSGFITLEAVLSVLTYAVSAGLPRLFPRKPAHL